MLRRFRMPKMNSKKNLITMFILIVFLLMTIYVFIKYALPLFNKQGKANREYNNGSSDVVNTNVAEILFFKADWCPHCKKAAPEWNELKTNIPGGTKINGYVIKYNTVDCTDDKDPVAKEMLQKYKVDGFPTIKMVKGNDVIEFDAKPEAKTLETFIQSTLNN